ncbi:tetratricopeptide repeat protein [Streptomyces sp. NPDC059752]|uniref:tetratricopeptide repeat protein n=1 Tax=unclassified Streptomyces TaxID=2593676 RepID=UPI0036580D32
MQPSNAVNLLASVREGQGRTDEAIAVLHEYGPTVVNNRDPLAELLVRHDRIDELRAYAAGAVDAYRNHMREDRWHTPILLAELLARHGRGDEAIEVVRALDSAEDWVVDQLCKLFAAEGRTQEGLAHLDALKARRGGEEWELSRLRGPLVAACGRFDDALALAHPEGRSPYALESLAHLLIDAGRPEEAATLLETDRLDHRGPSARSWWSWAGSTRR